MTLDEARKEAQAYADKHQIVLAVVHDPTSMEDWQTEEEAYNYCAPNAVDLMFGPGLRAKLATRIETITPKGRHE